MCCWRGRSGSSWVSPFGYGLMTTGGSTGDFAFDMRVGGLSFSIIHQAMYSRQDRTSLAKAPGGGPSITAAFSTLPGAHRYVWWGRALTMFRCELVISNRAPPLLGGGLPAKLSAWMLAESGFPKPPSKHLRPGRTDPPRAARQRSTAFNSECDRYILRPPSSSLFISHQPRLPNGKALESVSY